MLSHQDYTVTHLTRHCGMELGKDVLAISSDGIPHCYQLKGGQGKRISLNDWNTSLHNQMRSLVEMPIVHHSIALGQNKKCYLVTNKFLDEEVTRAIDDMNRDWEARGESHRKLEVIERGTLLRWAKELESQLWPSEPFDTKELLELYYSEGDDCFPKEKFCNLFEAFFKLDERDTCSETESTRLFSSGALLCSIATESFQQKQNYVASVEAWTIYLSYCFAAIEKWSLDKKSWSRHVNIANDIIYTNLLNLCEEISAKELLTEGDMLVDMPFYQPRITWLVSLMSVLYMWRKINNEERSEIEDLIENIINKNSSKVRLWGEASVPQLLAKYWYMKFSSGTAKSDFFLHAILNGVVSSNQPENPIALPNPYYQFEDYAPYLLGLEKKPLRDTFRGRSYSMEALIHLYVRRNWKQQMKLLWPDITRIAMVHFEYSKRWEICRWRAKEGHIRLRPPNFTESWDNLKTEADESDGADIPDAMKTYPLFVLLFVICFPHRFNSSVARWLDSNLVRP